MLTEWWTYRPHDFLMFSPRIYWRLFESINENWWPMALALGGCAVVALAMGVALSVGVMRVTGRDAVDRGADVWPPWIDPVQRVFWPLMLTLLAATWATVAWAFLWQRYTPIFWAAEAAVWAFAVQALAWLLLAGRLARQGRGSQVVVSIEPRRLLIGGVLAAAAIALYPLLAPMAGRPWQQAELFGLAPDPTVIFSLGVLLLLPGSAPIGKSNRMLAKALWLLPLAWCCFSSATLALMGSWSALVPLLAALLVVKVALPSRRYATHASVQSGLGQGSETRGC